MKAPLFILGFLIGHGPLHGYRIKQLIVERAADVASIKLPTIYYHLEQLHKNGFVTSQKEKKGRRPDRFVYEITSSGRQHFKKLLARSLEPQYAPEFDIDAVLFFQENLEPGALQVALEAHEQYLSGAVNQIKTRREETLAVVSDDITPIMRAIFSHQLVHYSAELRWVRAVQLDLASQIQYT